MSSRATLGAATATRRVLVGTAIATLFTLGWAGRALAASPPQPEGAAPIAATASGDTSSSANASASRLEPAASEPLPMLEGGTTATYPPATPAEGAPIPASIAGQRFLGVFATALSFDGFGLGLRIGSRAGIDLSGGYSPIVATYIPSGTNDIHFKFLSSLQLNATVFFGFYRTSPRVDLGVMLGYKYNSLVSHGVGAAFYAQFDLAEHWALHFFVGPAVFPAAEDRIRREAGWPSSGLVSSGLSWLQGGAGGAIAFFP